MPLVVVAWWSVRRWGVLPVSWWSQHMSTALSHTRGAGGRYLVPPPTSSLTFILCLFNIRTTPSMYISLKCAKRPRVPTPVLPKRDNTYNNCISTDQVPVTECLFFQPGKLFLPACQRCCLIQLVQKCNAPLPV